MKLTQLLFVGILFVMPSFSSAQSIVGDWIMEGKAEDGTKISNKVSFKKNGTLTVDFGNNGSIEVQASYTLDGNQISINDTSKESPCYGQVGIYEISIKGAICTAKVIKDPCDVRRGDGEPGTMKRLK